MRKNLIPELLRILISYLKTVEQFDYIKLYPGYGKLHPFLLANNHPFYFAVYRN